MSAFKTGNPTLTEKIFDKSLHENANAFGVMSVRGTINKFGFLLLMVMASAMYVWNVYAEGNTNTATTLMIAGMFGFEMGFAFDSSPLSIGISLFIVGIAALNLLLDFDSIEKAAEMGAPKYMEWYGAFGLLVTLVWLYLEILKLLRKLNSKD